MSDLIDRHRALINQIRWERDTAIAQLSKIGKGLGERMDDVVKVVRCKDCKWWETYKGKPNQDEYNCYISDVFTNKDFFCAGGERRTDE